MPSPERQRIDETGTGRDGGDRYTSRIAAGGSINVVARPNITAYLMYGLLGIKEVTGVGPYEHLLRPEDDQPYFTIWRDLGGAGLVERFEDVKFVSGTVQGSAGGLVMLNTNVAGTKTTRLTTGMPVGGTLETAFPFRVPGVDYQARGEQNRAISEFSCTINVPMTAIQTDEIFDSFIEPGLRTIDLTYTEVFRDLELYNSILYGGEAGTALSEGILHDVWSATFGDLEAGPGFMIEIGNLAYLSAPLEPNPGGEPLRMSVSGSADPMPDDSDIFTAAVTNSMATIS
jgi:hypothetical protein